MKKKRFSGRLATMPLADIANVDIDPKGTFKYVLIQVSRFSVKNYKKKFEIHKKNTTPLKKAEKS